MVVNLVGPISISLLLVRGLRGGGWRRLWQVALLVSGGLLILSVLKPEIVFYNHAPRVAAGCYTWPFPLAPLAAAMVVQCLGHNRIPGWVRGVPAATAAWMVFHMDTWIA